MTAIDLITSALRLIRVTASGEVPTNEEANDALTVLNDLIDSWNNERMNIFTLTISEFPLVPSQQTYTLGTGGNFNIARPANIERMSIVILNNPAQPLELPMEMLSDQGWQAIPVKAVPSTYPLKVYDDGAYPLRHLSFWPVPTIINNIRIYGWTALTSPAALTTALAYPPGYNKALRYNLAVDLAAEFGTPLDPTVAAIAAMEKGKIKSINTPSLETHCEAALIGTGGKRIYNWLTDGPATRG